MARKGPGEGVREEAGVVPHHHEPAAPLQEVAAVGLGQAVEGGEGELPGDDPAEAFGAEADGRAHRTVSIPRAP